MIDQLHNIFLKARRQGLSRYFTQSTWPIKGSKPNKYRHMKPWSGKAECARRRNRSW